MRTQCVRIVPACVRTAFGLRSPQVLFFSLFSETVTDELAGLLLEERGEVILDLCERNANAFQGHCEGASDGFGGVLDGAVIFGVLPHPAEQFVEHAVG